MEIKIKIKKENQRFVFADMGYQDFPHETETDCVVVAKSVDLTNKKIENGQLVDKTQADLDAEVQAVNAELDAQYKAQRVIALSSPELTIYHDSTLSQADKDAINAVRQDWYDMTAQNNYPVGFVQPSL